jgi:hypothetical protein
MLLIYDNTSYKPLVKRLAKEQITETGQVIKFDGRIKGQILLQTDSLTKLYVHPSYANTYENVTSFIKEREMPGIIIISSKPQLEKYELLNTILRDKILSTQQVCLIGQHVFNKDEKDFMHKYHVPYFSMRAIASETLLPIIKKVKSVTKKWSDCMIIIDSNVLDYPIIRTNLSGGLTTRELITLIQQLKMVPQFRESELIISHKEARVAVKLMTEMFRD